MLLPIEPVALLFVLAGALMAGFTTGFAGFGTGLVAAGLWFHALPAHMVPPLVALASVAGQLTGVIAVRRAFDWRACWPYLLGGALGVPIGVAALGVTSADVLKAAVAAFLLLYAASQLAGLWRLQIGSWGGRASDGVVGFGGGVLGGFAGLSGVLPLVWLQMRGGPSAGQRATYQPFNLVVLALAGIAMAASGKMGRDVAVLAALCLPATIAGAWLGIRAYRGVGEDMFRRVVLILLLLSGSILLFQAIKSG